MTRTPPVVVRRQGGTLLLIYPNGRELVISPGGAVGGLNWRERAGWIALRVGTWLARALQRTRAHGPARDRGARHDAGNATDA